MLVAMIRGFFRGFAKELLSLIGLAAAFFAGYYAAENFDKFHLAYFDFINNIKNYEVKEIIIFVSVFIIVSLVFAVISFLLTKLLDILLLGFINKIGGFFLQESKFL
jgi:membrane protein required for colicin V production